jgi:hypothetical protein
MLAVGRAQDGRGQWATLTAMPSPSTAIERHIRLLARLAFLPPRIIAAVGLRPAVWRRDIKVSDDGVKTGSGSTGARIPRPGKFGGLIALGPLAAIAASPLQGLALAT